MSNVSNIMKKPETSMASISRYRNTIIHITKMSSKVKQYKKHGLKYFGESERETIFFVKSFCIKYIDQLQIKATL